MIKGFLFDLDGVIVETAIFHYRAWKRMANELGFDISEEFNETLKGVSRVESLERILKHGGISISEADKEKYMKLKNEWYLEMVSQMTTDDILEGIPTFFKEIKKTEIKIGLGSVSKNAKMILEKVGLIDQFDVIIDGTKISKGKPDPEVFLKGAQELSLNPIECIVFEDAVAGIEAAINAGMKTVGIGNENILNQASIVYPNLVGVSVAEVLEKLN